jgi:WXG100 family type VII secretion target
MAVNQTRNTAHINKAASTMDEAHGIVGGQISTVRGHMQDLASAWKGQSGTTFQQAMNEWDSNGQKLLTAMANIADLLRKAGGRFDGAEAQLHQDANKFQNDLQSYPGLTVRA